MQASEDEPSPLPAHLRDDELARVRSEAVDLLREAEELEHRAKTVRRRARSRLKHYENLVQEHYGQMRIDQA